MQISFDTIGADLNSEAGCWLPEGNAILAVDVPASNPDAQGKTGQQGGLPQQVDAMDHKILGMLQQDGRMSYRQIARELGVSEGTIRFRVNKLQSSGALRIVVIADPFTLGYRILGFMLLKVTPGKHDEVVEAVSSWEESTYVSSLASTSDIFLQFVCRDHEHMHELLHDRLGQLEGVLSVETHTELKIHKVAYGYPIEH